MGKTLYATTSMDLMAANAHPASRAQMVMAWIVLVSIYLNRMRERERVCDRAV